jgi:hypothetical protein
MYKKFLKEKGFIVALMIVFIFPVMAYANYGEVGFFTGLWQGLTFPFRLFLKLIWTDIIIYEQFDSTYMYHVGYLVGVLAIIGGSAETQR